MKLDGARIFMTGCAGFIGSHFVRDKLHAMRMSYQRARDSVGWKLRGAVRRHHGREGHWLVDHPRRWAE